ncbi:hypothetical protein ACVS9V_004351 [Cronobacter malonaticus]
MLRKINDGSPKNVEWNHYIVSDPIDPDGENVDKTLIINFFKGKKITIDNIFVKISDTCNYMYAINNISPLEYWQSKKTADLYKNKLAHLNVNVTDKIGLITPLKSTVECNYPFVYFLKINESLVFVLNNRMIIYYPYSVTDEHKNACVHKKQSPELVYENGDIDECYYGEINISETYSKFKKERAEDEGKYLEKHINVNHDVVIKCNDGCIKVKYTWRDKKNLVVTQDFNGGETVIYFSESNSGTNVLVKSFPD